MAEVRDFLFEIGSEEMPSAPLQKAIAQFNKLVVSGLKDSGLSFGEVKILSSRTLLRLQKRFLRSSVVLRQKSLLMQRVGQPRLLKDLLVSAV